MGPVSEFTNLVEEQHGGQQRGRTVGNRHRHPDTQRTEMRRQNKEQRDEEQHLPREGEENRLVRLADILEKIGGHDLESDDRENAQHDPQPLGRRRDHPLGRSGIKTVGEKIGAVRLDALERLIARNGFVADARVTVSYSGVLHVAVWQRTPLMRLLIDGYNSYVTEEGYLFAVPRASSVYVPVITGTYRPPFPASYVGYAADYRREQMQQIDDKIAELEREKYPLYRRELKNDENIRSLRRMLIKKRWFESSESFGERVRELRKRKEQLRRKYRYEAQVIQSAIDKISEKQEAERRRQKILTKRYEDFSKLTTFVKWMENDDFWRSEIVQITARTTESGAIDLELTPRSGNYTILFGRLDDAEQKLDKLLRFYREGLGKAGWDRYRTINVKYAGQVVCTEW